MNLLEKLLSVQTKLNAPKKQYNKFGNYYYRNCEDILNAAKPLCEEVKAVITVTDQIVQIGDRYYVQANAKFWDCEKKGEYTEVSAFAREEENKKGMDSSQLTGSTSSYARKYALNGLLAVDDTKDSDTTNKGASNNTDARPGSKKEEPKKDTLVTDIMIKTVENELIRTCLKENVILTMFNIEKMKDMTVQQYMNCMNKFKLTPDGKEGA